MQKPATRQIGLVASHEFGHGVFALMHPWETENQKGRTNYLMDQTATNNLSQIDWKQTYDPKFKLYGFQGDEDGEFEETLLTPDWEPFTFDGSYTFHDMEIKTPNGAVFGIKYNDKFYDWDLTKKGYYNENNSLPIVKLKQNEINDLLKIALYWNNGECGTNVLYHTIWQNVKGKAGTITLDYLGTPNIISKFVTVPCVDQNNDTETNGVDVCAGKNFSEIRAKVNEYNTYANNLSEKSVSDIADFIATTDYCALKDIETGNKTKLLDKLYTADYLTNKYENAIVKIISITKNSEALALYNSLIKVNNSNVITKNNLKEILPKITNAGIAFYLNDNKKYFLESLANVLKNLDDDNKKWDIINTIVIADWDDITDQDEKNALIGLISTLNDYRYKKEIVPAITEMFTKMLNNDCKNISGNGYKTIYEIAFQRLENKEIFSKYTQGDPYTEYFDNGQSCKTTGDLMWNWTKPGRYTLTYSFVIDQQAGSGLGNIRTVTETEVQNKFYWASVLNSNPDILQKLETDKNWFFNRFLTGFMAYKQTIVTENANFWANTTITCTNLQNIFTQINTKENTNSLSKVSASIKNEILTKFYNCTTGNPQQANVLDGNTNPIVKLLASFDPTDATVIKTIEDIGLEKFEDRHNRDALSKVFVWLGSQLNTTNKSLPLKKEDVLGLSDIAKASGSLFFKLEANMLDFQNFSADVSSKTILTVKGIPYEYKQNIVVYIVDDFTFMGETIKGGSVLVMPLIQAYAMSEVNRSVIAEKSAWLAFDVVTLALRVGELKILISAGNYVQKAIVISDLIGSAAGITINLSDESAFTPETRYKLQMLSIIASLPQAARLVKGIDGWVKAIDDEINLFTNAAQQSRMEKYFAKIQQALPPTAPTNAVLSAFQTKINSTPALKALWNLLDTPALKEAFKLDFATKPEAVINLLKKNDSELFAGWLKFRKKPTNLFICE